VGCVTTPPEIIGVGLTTIVVLAGADTHDPVAAVAVTVYVPAAAAVTFVIVGLEVAFVKVFGPVHDHVTAPANVVVAFRFNVFPVHNGVLPEATGVAGVGFTTTTVVAAGEVH
jgi:hypothetical protein